MQTAKTIQLRDGNNNYISPATNIDSIYYEAPGSGDDQNIIFRHQLSKYFPVYVNNGNDTSYSSYKVADVSNLELLDISTKNARIVDNEGNDVILSNFVQRRLKGTNYYALDVSNYNFSEIMQSYAGLSYVDTQIHELNNYISQQFASATTIYSDKFSKIDASLTDISDGIADASAKIKNLNAVIIYDTSKSYNELLNCKMDSSLIPGCNYKMLYYPKQYSSNSNEYYDTSYYIVLYAIDNNTFDENIVDCQPNNNFVNNNLNLWQLKFDFDKYEITYMKDEYGNEAPFDFKSRKQYVSQNVSSYLFEKNNTDYSLTGNCTNNIIKSDSSCISFKINNANVSINNNFIGDSDDIHVTLNKHYINNIIGNSNTSIGISASNLICQNNIIGNSNSSIFIVDSSNDTIENHNYDIILNNNRDNIIKSDCSTLRIQKNSNSNIINDECYNIILNNSTNFNVISQGCRNVSFENSIESVTVGPYVQNPPTLNSSNVYYSYQMMYARKFENISD